MKLESGVVIGDCCFGFFFKFGDGDVLLVRCLFFTDGTNGEDGGDIDTGVLATGLCGDCTVGEEGMETGEDGGVLVSLICTFGFFLL